MSDSPRAYWRLGETSGTSAWDDLRGSAIGAYQHGVALGQPGALAGDADLAAGFDGGDDQVGLGDPPDGSLDFGQGDFSIEAWVKATANDERAVVSKRPYGTAVPFWQLTVTDDGSQAGRVRVNVSDGAASIQVYGPAVRVDNGSWHHVVVVFDRDAGITIHVDGAGLTTPATVPGDLSNAGELLIGKSAGYPPFKGDVDEVALYPGVLGADRVAAHYDRGRLGPP